MKMYLVILKYKAPRDKIEAFAARHFDYLREHFDKNTFVLAGRRRSRRGGVILAMGSDYGRIESIVRSDPFCLNDLASFEIIEFDLGSWHRDLNALFGAGSNV